MDAEQTEMSLRDFGRVVERRKWIVVCAVLASTLAALVLSAMQTSIYSADAEVLIQPRNNTSLFESQSPNINARAIETEIRVIEGETVRTRVQQNLGLAEAPPKVRASSINDTDVVRLTVRDPNASNAQTYANTYAAAYADVRREQSAAELIAAASELEATIAEIEAQAETLEPADRRRRLLIDQVAGFNTTLDQLRVDAALVTGGAITIKSADRPESPVVPTPVRSAGMAALLGLLLGLGAAFLVDYLDDKVRTSDDLERLTDHPVLAVVPVDPPPDNRPIAVSEPGHVASEAYRGLRTNVQFRGLDETLSVIQVTSSIAGEGKTTTAANLAVVLAQAGHRVALVDADLRRPRLHELFGTAASPGLTDLLLGASPREVVNHVATGADSQLSLYCSGVAPANPSEMLGGRRMRQLLKDMGSHYDYVVIDSAPILPVSDSLAIANAVDGVIFVVQAGHVTDENVKNSLSRLERVAAPVFGLVLNQVPGSSRESDYTSAGYSSVVARAPSAAREIDHVEVEREADQLSQPTVT